MAEAMRTSMHPEQTPTPWTVEIKDIPRQAGSSDCGVMVCEYARRISRGNTTPIQSQEQTDLRYGMCAEIMTHSRATTTSEQNALRDRVPPGLMFI
jgi:Ulp1 family protease